MDKKERLKPEEDANDGNDRQGLSLTRRDFVVGVGAVTGGIAFYGSLVHSQTKIAEPEPATAAHAVAIELVINGKQQRFDLDPRVTLLDLLRENLGLTGTKKGCDHGQCGACTVLANGRRINSCLSLAVVHDGDEITTIEGIAQNGELHPVQAAFLEDDGFQCGYCTPGQICSAVALLKEAQDGDASIATKDLVKIAPVELTADEIRERMSGNICRCGAYPGIVTAVQVAQGKSRRAERRSA